MKANELTVIFKHNADADTRTLPCKSVKFGIEFVGDVEEYLDYTLEENYQAVRETIEIVVTLDIFQSLFMADFLYASDKKLTIDGVDFEVVNAANRIEFDLFRNNIIRTQPRLRFRVKTTGIATRSITIPVEGGIS